MNKKISQFELTTKLQEQDLITLVQDGSNKNITSGSFTTSLSGTFATNERVDAVEEDVEILDTKVNDNYKDLSNKIVEGDTSVTTNLNSAITSYYDVLNNKIITLDTKHDTDMSEIGGTMQEWIDDIDNRSTLQQLQDALNRLTVAENTITALSELIANGGGSGSAPGYHTQSTATIFPLSGYYKANDASPLATSDTLNQALSKLENQVEAVASSSGSLPVIKYGESTPPADNFLYTSLKTAEDYLNKHGDTADGKITMLQGLQAGNTFRSGWDGVGASLYPLGSKWNMELDNLFVRGNMTINELTVNEIKAVGGDILVTVADMKCIEVEELADSYKCYFDDQEGTKYNQFIVNDLAICQKFDGKNVKRYWRKVNATGSNYITLSKDVCEPGSGKPEADDEILQLGHMYESDPDYNLQMDERRNAIFISAKGDNAPRISYYKNIDTFSLADEDGVVRERVVIGGDQTKFVGTIYQTSDTGIVRVPVYRGIWVSGNTYYYYDQVSHKGSLWICMDPNGTKDEPNENDDQWQKQVSKGEDGKSGDDKAKWVEIVGDRLFLFDTPDFSGTPTPRTIHLTANVYGMENPTYEWKMLNAEGTKLSAQSSIDFPYTAMPTDSRTLSIRCTVTNSDGTTYYDDTQLAKLSNGAEGLDAYYIDLSNGTVAVPFDADGVTPLVDLSTITTDVYAYHGINPIAIKSITYSTTSGGATVSITGSKVTLTSISQKQASIDLNVTLEDGVSIVKTWYVNKVANGENGFNGEDAAYVYMSGEQFFHYKTGKTVPENTTITLTADSFNIINPTYKWYWAIAGTYDWQLLSNETNSTLVVSYNGIYFTSTKKDEISFKCVVSGAGAEFSDFMTINNVRDGENVYRGILTNENTGVPADSGGVVTDYSTATTTARLKYGSQDITDFKLTTSLQTGTGSVTYTQSTQTIKCTSLTSDSAMWRVDFISPASGNKVVDSVDFVVTKSKAGVNGDVGNSPIQIFCNTSNASTKPSRPTFTYRPSSGGATSGGYTWYPDPKYSSSQTTWISSGNYDPNAKQMAYDESIGGYWTDPLPHSGKDGEKGDKGDKGEKGNTGAPGSDGWNGPSLSYRGTYSSSKYYAWTVNPDVRDVVKYGSVYYMVANGRRGLSSFKNVTPGSNTSYWSSFGSSFESIATGLLFAEKATIAGMDFYNNCIAASSGRFFLDGRYESDINNGWPIMSFGNNAVKDGVPSSSAALKIYGGGTLTVGDGTVTANAGITGAGTGSDQVRFWAGKPFDDGTAQGNRFWAPFRVYQDGRLVANSATITGNISASTANFTGNVSVGSLSGWNIPGVKTICHYGSNLRGTIYSQGGCQVSSISRTGTGEYTVYHNIGHTNYVVLWQGQARTNSPYSDSAGFRGTVGVTSTSSSSFKIICVDTDNNRHDVGDKDDAIDLVIIGYAQ